MEIHIHAARLLIASTFIQFCLIIHQIYSMLPHFRRTRNGDLLLYRREEAEKGLVKSMPGLCEPPSQVKAKAVRAVKSKNGDAKNVQILHGQFPIQFGKYRGQTFLWMVENCLSYAGWLRDAMRRERTSMRLRITYSLSLKVSNGLYIHIL